MLCRWRYFKCNLIPLIAICNPDLASCKIQDGNTINTVTLAKSFHYINQITISCYFRVKNSERFLKAQTLITHEKIDGNYNWWYKNINALAN